MWGRPTQTVFSSKNVGLDRSIESSCKDLSSRDSTLLGPQQGRELHKPRVREKTQDSEEPMARACTTWHRGRDNISWHQYADTKTTRKPACTWNKMSLQCVDKGGASVFIVFKKKSKMLLHYNPTKKGLENSLVNLFSGKFLTTQYLSKKIKFRAKNICLNETGVHYVSRLLAQNQEKPTAWKGVSQCCMGDVRTKGRRGRNRWQCDSEVQSMDDKS